MIGWLATAACSLVAFCSLASEFVREGEYGQVDSAIADRLRHFASPTTDRVFQAITDGHDTIPVSIAVALIALLLSHRKAYRAVAWLIVVVPGGMLINTLLKHALQRPRPALSSILTADSFSFPSGHTAGAALFYGVLIALAFANLQSFVARAAVAAIGALAVFVVALSRVYLQVHYPSDVAAALLEAVTWLSICLAARTFLLQRSGIDVLHVGRTSR